MMNAVRTVASVAVAIAACAAATGCTIQPVTKESAQKGDPSSASASGSGSDGNADGSQAGNGNANNAGGVQGKVPANLVGSWSYASTSAGIMYEFHQDGSYDYTGTMENSLSCTKINIFQSGAAVFDAKSVTLHMTDGKNVSSDCNGGGKTIVEEPEVTTKSWRVEGDTLYLWGADCDGSDTCAESYSR